MATGSLRILCEITFPNDVVGRLWDGAGPYVDADGEVWVGTAGVTGLDVIEKAINGESYTLELVLAGVRSDLGDLAWQSYLDDEVIDGTVRIMLQACDAYDQPDGGPRVVFSGKVDNLRVDDVAGDNEVTSTITIEATNRFTYRRLTNGAALSDADQKARSAVLNPGANADRFCERIPGLLDKTIVWPRWS